MATNFNDIQTDIETLLNFSKKIQYTAVSD